MKNKKGADAADGKSDDRTQGKGRTLGDETHAIADGVDRMPVQVLAYAPRNPAKQRFEAKAETHESSKKVRMRAGFLPPNRSWNTSAACANSAGIPGSLGQVG